MINGRDWKTTWEKEDKLDAAVADADREKVPCLYLHWMTLCEYGMSVVAKDVWKKTFGEMVDVSIQSMVAMDAQAMNSLKSEIPAILTFCYVGMAGICVCRLDADGLVLSGGFVGKAPKGPSSLQLQGRGRCCTADRHGCCQRRDLTQRL